MDILKVHRLFRGKCDFFTGQRLDDIINEVQLAYFDRLIELSDNNSSLKMSRLMDADLGHLTKTVYIKPTTILDSVVYNYQSDSYLSPTLSGPVQSGIVQVMQVDFSIQSVMVDGIKNYSLLTDSIFSKDSWLNRSWLQEADSIKTFKGQYAHDYARARVLVLPSEVSLANGQNLNWSDNTSMTLIDLSAQLGNARISDPSLQAQILVKDKLK